MAVEIGHLTVDVSMEPNVQKLIAEHAALTAELNELASSSGSDHIAAKYWKQRQDARNELAKAKNDRDDARAERDALSVVIEQAKVIAPFTVCMRADGSDNGETWVQQDELLAILAQSPASALARVQADAWDESAEVTVEWAVHQSTPSGVPIDPPANPYREEADRG